MIHIEEPHHHKDEQEELAAQKARQRTSLLHYGINHFCSLLSGVFDVSLH
jgi:hypothetical protein